MTTKWQHPSFRRASLLTEPLRSHFPKSVEEAQSWVPHTKSRALASKVLVVARTRVECAWRAYVDAVPGQDHQQEIEAVLAYGATLPEVLARVLFPEFDEVPYAE